MAEDTSDADAAMAAMGLPSNFSAPAFPRGAGRGARPPPPGPSNRGARDSGWSGRGRGRGAGPFPSSHSRGQSSNAPSGPAAMRGGYQQSFGNNRGGEHKRKRGGGSNFQQRQIQQGPLPPLEEIPPLIRPSFTEEDPWSHLS